MFRRTLAAILTDQNASSGDSSIFVAYDVETDEDDPRDATASSQRQQRKTPPAPPARPPKEQAD